MKLHRPFRPWFITQKWGVPNLAYEQFGFKEHNGLDAACISVNPYKQAKTWPVYCPAEGLRVYATRYSPNGGGFETVLSSKEEIDLPTGRGYLHLYFMHNEKNFLTAGYEPALGELIAIGDNTGFSTGPHSHIGAYRMDKNGRKLDSNKANGSFNPEPLFTEQYAVDLADLPTLLKSNLRYYKYVVGL